MPNRSRTTSTDRYIALLRGINVGGRNKLPMRELTACIESLGGREVRTYIQSGNAVFTLDTPMAAGWATALADSIKRSAGLSTPVIVFRAAEFRAIMRRNPYLARGSATDPAHLHVYLLSEKATASALAKLDPDRSPGDTFIATPRAIYLHLPHGVARTKITNQYVDTTLGLTSTARNWRTMNAIAALLDAADA